MSVRVLRPGLLTTVQDRGRHGYQRVGLCPGGAMDPVALALANALVGNPPDEAALEITVIGPELVFEVDTLVAVCGAEFDTSFPHNRPVLARAGTRFNAGRATRGARAYIAVAGGFAVEPVLGSRSTYLPGQFGGYEGRALKHGDVLPLRETAAVERFSTLKNIRDGTVRWSAPPLTLPDR
jgi:antagonist of KipI